MQVIIMTFEAAEPSAAPEKAEQYWAAWRAYGQALSEANVLVALTGLQPGANAETHRSGDAGPRIRVGPDANPRGLPGGYLILDVADLDEAVEWASRCPAAANGTVEVRPVLPDG